MGGGSSSQSVGKMVVTSVSNYVENLISSTLQEGHSTAQIEIDDSSNVLLSNITVRSTLIEREKVMTNLKIEQNTVDDLANKTSQKVVNNSSGELINVDKDIIKSEISQLITRNSIINKVINIKQVATSKAILQFTHDKNVTVVHTSIVSEENHSLEQVAADVDSFISKNSNAFSNMQDVNNKNSGVGDNVESLGKSLISTLGAGFIIPVICIAVVIIMLLLIVPLCIHFAGESSTTEITNVDLIGSSHILDLSKKSIIDTDNVMSFTLTEV